MFPYLATGTTDLLLDNNCINIVVFINPPASPFSLTE